MVTFIILINTTRKQVNTVAEELSSMDEVSEVYSVSGNYDLVAMVRAKSNEDLANFVTEKLQDVSGIEQTETMLALRTFSSHDLEAMFSV